MACAENLRQEGEDSFLEEWKSPLCLEQKERVRRERWAEARSIGTGRSLLRKSVHFYLIGNWEILRFLKGEGHKLSSVFVCFSIFSCCWMKNKLGWEQEADMEVRRPVRRPWEYSCQERVSRQIQNIFRKKMLMWDVRGERGEGIRSDFKVLA